MTVKELKTSFTNNPIFGILLYVSLITGSIGLIFAIESLGLSSPLPAQVLVMGIMILIIVLLENLLPYRKSWGTAHGTESTDLTYLIVVSNAIPKIMTVFWNSLFLGSTLWLQQWFSVDSLWVHEWPVLLQAALILFIVDFIRYWIHRWAHQIPLLWRLHEIHHSSTKMYWLATMRFHPLEKLYWMIPEILPMIILGVSPEVLVIYYVFNSVNSILQHSNIRMPLGPLNYIMNLQEYHFWHHSKIISESNNNYGSNLIIWDFVFRTRFLPTGKEVSTLGLHDEKFPSGFIRQFLRPFMKKTNEKNTQSQKPIAEVI